LISNRDKRLSLLYSRDIILLIISIFYISTNKTIKYARII